VRGWQPPQQIVAAPDLQLGAPGSLGVVVPAPDLTPTLVAKPVNLPNLMGPRTAAVRAAVAKAIVEFVIDDSGSMYGSYGDDTGIRYAAANSLVRLMRRSGGGRAGVIHWGSCVGGVLQITDIKKDRKEIDRALSIPPDLGGTEMGPALSRAAEELSGLAAGETPVVFVITDGICDPDGYVTSAMANLPSSSVHLLLIDRSNCCSQGLEATWRATPASTVTRLNHLDTKGMALELAQVFADSLGLSLATPANSKTTTKAPTK
jgi:hypothetical protein